MTIFQINSTKPHQVHRAPCAVIRCLTICQINITNPHQVHQTHHFVEVEGAIRCVFSPRIELDPRIGTV